MVTLTTKSEGIKDVKNNRGTTDMNRVNTILGPRKNEANILGPRNPRSQSETDAIADKLVEMFNSPDFRPLFLKAAWRLSEARLMEIAEKALASGYNSPRAYFISSVKRDKAYYA